ncbi:MAG: hypothetical protein ACK4VZ_09785 [Paracoccaceae bacterium]
MKSTLAVLLATTAVIGALGLPALSAIGSDPGITATAVSSGGSAADRATILASNDDDSRKVSRRNDDDEDEDEDDDCDDDDDDDEDGGDCRRAAPAPARTGPITPPANGLFSPGAAPKVRTN